MKAITRLIEKKITRLQKKIDELQAEQEKYQKALGILVDLDDADTKQETQVQDKPIEEVRDTTTELPKTMICLYKETHDLMNNSQQTFIHVNKNKHFRDILDDLIKNKINLEIYDDSIDQQGKNILESVKNYIGVNK